MPEDWGDFLLAENPQWAYFSSSPFTTSTQQGFSPAQQQYWQGQYGNVWNRYMGEVGSATKAGQDPMSFTNYLEDMPFSQQYYQNVQPQQRGGSTRFNPTTRFVY